MYRGGFPELWANPDHDPTAWHQAYLSTYLERDIRNLLNVRSLRDFDRFLRLVGYRTSQKLSLSDLAKDIGIAPSTAKNWLSVLEASFQVQILEPYFNNMGKRLVKTPKCYLMDTGLACYLNTITTPGMLISSPVAGALWETHCVNQLTRWVQATRGHIPLWFWQTSSGTEVDIVLDEGGMFTLFECKLTATPARRDLSGITAFTKTYGKDAITAAYILCPTPSPYKLDDVIVCAPKHLRYP